MIDVQREGVVIRQMTVNQLRARYAQVFGETTACRHKAWLLKRILWRLQALAEGDLSERARARARELACDADLRLRPPHDPRLTAVEGPLVTPRVKSADTRVPPVGSLLSRRYRGQVVQVRVLAAGFAWEGRHFRSLSAVANAVTGTHTNGFLFFGLRSRTAR